MISDVDDVVRVRHCLAKVTVVRYSPAIFAVLASFAIETEVRWLSVLLAF